MNNFNSQFATQKLRQETSMTGTGATFTPGTGEQTAPRATKKVVRKKLTPEEKDVEPKLAASKAKVYMKDKWGWEDAPSVPNRPSKGGFIYKQLFEELSNFVNEEVSVGDFNHYRSTLNDAYQELGRDGDMVGRKAVADADKSLENAEAAKEAIEKSKITPGNKSTYLKAIEGIKSYLSQPPKKSTASLDENYSKFKTETKTRGKSDQFHQAVRGVKKKVQEINRLFEYVSRLKLELSEGEDGLEYKRHTEKALAKIKEMVSELNQNIKKFK